MAFQERGYTARVLRLSVGTAGLEVPFRFRETDDQYVGGHSARLRVVVSATCRMYFTEDDFAADRNYIELTTALNPFSEPVGDRKVWFRAPTGTVTVELLAMVRG